MLYKPTYGQIAAGKYRSHPRYQGCVGHWLMNEGGGLTAYNLASNGNANNGTLTGGPVWAPGLFGSAVRFNGTSQYITAPALAPGFVTLSAWANSSATGNRTIFSCAGDELHLFWHTDTGPSFNIQMSGYYAATSAALSINTWYHLVGTYDGTIMRLYVNGVETDTTTPTSGGPIVATGTQYIGAHYGLTFNWFSGIIDDVRRYNRALDAGEVRSLYSDQFLEFREAPKRKYVFLSPLFSPSGSLGLLGVGR